MASSKFGSKFFGERYQQYVDELTAEGTIDGEKLSAAERIEGFKKRKDKIDFQQFVEKILQKKQSTSNKTPELKPSLGSGGGAIIKATKTKIDSGKLVPTEAGDKTEENLDEILKGIDSILNSLKEQEKTKKKEAKKKRRESEKTKRKKSENRLEAGIFKGLAKATNKVLGPVKGLFEKVFDFIKTVLLGRVLFKLLEWIGNKDNQEKLTAIGTFLSKTWPALLAAYLLFGNGLGRFITRLLFMTAKFIPKIIMTLGKLALAHPIAAAAILAAGGAGYLAIRNAQMREQENKVDDAGTVTPKEFSESRKDDDKSNDQTPSGNQLRREMVRQGGLGLMFSEGGLVPQGFAGGGHAHGRPRSSGTDTIPAMLTPGEFVMSRGAVQKYGSNTLAAMNAAGGGTNRPKVLNDTVYAKTGGEVEDPTTNRQSAEKQPKVPAGGNLTDEQKASMFEKAGMTSVSNFVRTNPTTGVQSTTPLIPSAKDKKEKTNMANAEQIAAAFLSTLEASGGQNASDAFQVMLNRTADAQAGGSMRVYGKSLFNQITAREQFSPYSSALYGSSADGAAASKYGKIAKTLGSNPAERKKKLLEIAGGSNGLQELEKLFNGGSASTAATVLADHQSNGNLSKKSREFIGNKVSFRGYSTSGAIRRGPGGNYFFGPGSKVGSLKEVSTGEQSISFSGAGGSSTDIASSSSSDTGGGSSGLSPEQLKEALKFGAGAAFDYNELRQSLGVKTASISKPSRPTSTVALQQMQSQQVQGQGQTDTADAAPYDTGKTGSDVPVINANEMISIRKVQVLGITI